jgi:hypothetical protein
LFPEAGRKFQVKLENRVSSNKALLEIHDRFKEFCTTSSNGKPSKYCIGLTSTTSQFHLIKKKDDRKLGRFQFDFVIKILLIPLISNDRNDENTNTFEASDIDLVAIEMQSYCHFIEAKGALKTTINQVRFFICSSFDIEI